MFADDGRVPGVAVPMFRPRPSFSWIWRTEFFAQTNIGVIVSPLSGIRCLMMSVSRSLHRPCGSAIVTIRMALSRGISTSCCTGSIDPEALASSAHAQPNAPARSVSGVATCRARRAALSRHAIGPSHGFATGDRSGSARILLRLDHAQQRHRPAGRALRPDDPRPWHRPIDARRIAIAEARIPARAVKPDRLRRSVPTSVLMRPCHKIRTGTEFVNAA